MQPIYIVNKTNKNDHPIAPYELIIKLSKNMPSCASLK